MAVIPVKAALDRYPGATPFKFGDTDALNVEILRLVRDGRKTITCDAVPNFEKRGEKIPEPGDVGIALWNHGLPALAIRTLSVGLLPFNEMTEDLVPDQAEFRDLEDWQKGYEEYLTRAGVFAPDVLMVVEHFELLEVF